MPSEAATARGAAAGAAIVAAHQEANEGRLPETVAVNLWGLDSIKTRGDNVGLVLWLVGARPVKEGTGRIARFQLIPLEELGRPRIDVLCNMSGIFRCGLHHPLQHELQMHCYCRLVAPARAQGHVHTSIAEHDGICAARCTGACSHAQGHTHTSIAKRHGLSWQAAL
jgi:hypothetical protein